MLKDLKNMKRLGRFLVGRPRVGCLFERQAHPRSVHALVDVDSAGEKQSRQSLSGGMIRSTAEAELYAGNHAGTGRWKFRRFARNSGRALPIQLHIDSSTAQSMLSRTGSGEAKQIEIQQMWLHEAVRSEKLTVEKITTQTNPSDLGSKNLTSERSEMLMRLVNCFYA